MSIVDLASTHLEWLDANVAGAEMGVRMYPLNIDLQRGTRTVLVEYPAGWTRTAAGTQPAGEELIPLTGTFTMSGQSAASGQIMVTTPRALRTETSVDGVTRAVLLYTGPGGGWVDGDAEATGSVATVTISALTSGDGIIRESTDGLAGHLELRDELPEDGLDEDAELIWLDAQHYAFVPRGSMPPQLDGRVLLRVLPRT